MLSNRQQYQDITHTLEMRTLWVLFALSCRMYKEYLDVHTNCIGGVHHRI